MEFIQMETDFNLFDLIDFFLKNWIKLLLIK